MHKKNISLSELWPTIARSKYWYATQPKLPLLPYLLKDGLKEISHKILDMNSYYKHKLNRINPYMTDNFEYCFDPQLKAYTVILDYFNNFVERTLCDRTGAKELEGFLIEMNQMIRNLEDPQLQKQLDLRDLISSPSLYLKLQRLLHELFSDKFQRQLKKNFAQALAYVLQSVIKAKAFKDGNKRIAFFLMNQVLLRSGYTPIVINTSNVEAYFIVINSIYQMIDPRTIDLFITDFIEANSKAVQEAIYIINPSTVKNTFDLRTAYFDFEHVDSDCEFEDISLATLHPDIHVVKAKGPDHMFDESFPDFFRIPPRISYTLYFPNYTYKDSDEEVMEKYYQTLSRRVRKTYKKAVRNINKLIKEGKLTLVFDHGENPVDFKDFLKFYTSTQAKRQYGLTPLTDSIKDAGITPAKYLEEGIKKPNSSFGPSFGIYLKEGGQIIGGLVANTSDTYFSKDVNHYQLGYALSDPEARKRIPEIQFFLLQELMKKSLERGFCKINGGIDPNLYGYDVGIGTLKWKNKTGFIPVTTSTTDVVGGSEFLKITNYDLFNKPIFFYQFAKDNSSVEAVLIITKDMTARIKEFEGITSKLHVYILENNILIPYKRTIQ